MEGPVMPAANNTNLVSSPSPSSSSLLPAFNPSDLVDHLTKVLSITLGATEQDLKANGSILSEARYLETLSKCSRFAAEPIVALYASKDVLEKEPPPEDVTRMLIVVCLFSYKMS
jgi:dynein heavy chain 1